MVRDTFSALLWLMSVTVAPNHESHQILQCSKRFRISLYDLPSSCICASATGFMVGDSSCQRNMGILVGFARLPRVLASKAQTCVICICTHVWRSALPRLPPLPPAPPFLVTVIVFDVTGLKRAYSHRYSGHNRLTVIVFRNPSVEGLQPLIE